MQCVLWTKRYIWQHRSGVNCGRSRVGDITVGITPVISTWRRARREGRGRPDQKPDRRIGTSSFPSIDRFHLDYFVRVVDQVNQSSKCDEH